MIVERAARSLGWASLGIGLAELAATKRLEQMMGLGNGENSGVLRTLGIRELMHGFDILAHRNPAPGVWSRVVGDALDAALLGVAVKKTRRPSGLAIAASLAIGITMLDMLLARHFAHRGMATD